MTQKGPTPAPLDSIEQRAERAMEEASRRRDEAVEQLREKHIQAVRRTLRSASWLTKWRHVVTVTLDEAVALSFGWEPMQAGLLQLPEYHDRLLVASRNAGRALPLAQAPSGAPSQQLWVEVRAFLQWARSVAWTLPPDLSRDEPQAPERSDSRHPRFTNREVDRVIDASKVLNLNGEPWTVRALWRVSRVPRPKIDAMCAQGRLPDEVTVALSKRRRRKSIGRRDRPEPDQS